MSNKATALRPWLPLYNTQRWRKMARRQLEAEPMCRFCSAQGKLQEAHVADHIEPHRGDYQKFFFGKLQSLCSRCHSGEKQELEVKGYTTNIGEDGWPQHDDHPANGNSRQGRN